MSSLLKSDKYVIRRHTGERIFCSLIDNCSMHYYSSHCQNGSSEQENNLLQTGKTLSSMKVRGLLYFPFMGSSLSHFLVILSAIVSQRKGLPLM